MIEKSYFYSRIQVLIQFICKLIYFNNKIHTFHQNEKQIDDLIDTTVPTLFVGNGNYKEKAYRHQFLRYT